MKRLIMQLFTRRPVCLSCFTALTVSETPQRRMDGRVRKDLKGSDPTLILSRNLLGGTDENCERQLGLPV
jgi:hypothetical protein